MFMLVAQNGYNQQLYQFRAAFHEIEMAICNRVERARIDADHGSGRLRISVRGDNWTILTARASLSAILRYPRSMTGETALTTVYRSTDRNAETDATTIKNLLVEAGLHPELLDETALGVSDGRWEVRVPASEAEEARELLEDANQSGADSVDPSHELDLVTVATTDGTIAEIEATSIQSILDANGINCVVIGNTTLPNLGFEIKVAKDDFDRARQAIEEAREAGPAAAEAEAGASIPDQKGV
jgi:Putative prokaryotic signal transducing protein